MPEHTWLKLAKQNNTVHAIPQPSTLISDNGISLVYVGGDGYIYKRSIPFLIENEIYCLTRLYPFRIVPSAERYDKITLKIQNLGYTEKPTNKTKFLATGNIVYDILQECGIRHGNLTIPHVIVKRNWSYIIDFAEARFVHDPRPDKLSEGDEYWIGRTWREISEMG